MGKQWNDDDDPRGDFSGRPGMYESEHELGIRLALLAMLILVIPPYIWLAKNLWEWAFS